MILRGVLFAVLIIVAAGGLFLYFRLGSMPRTPKEKAPQQAPPRQASRPSTTPLSPPPDDDVLRKAEEASRMMLEEEMPPKRPKVVEAILE